MKENYNDYHAFKKITQNTIILDFSKCKYLGEIHSILKEKFGLPQYYGENWDALWDLLRDVFSDDEEYLVEIYNLNKMNSALRNSCEKMLEVFEDLHNIIPNFKFTIVGDWCENNQIRFNRRKNLMVPDRIWYEADINYKSGYRDSKRILWSNDGLIFVTYDHYRTYCEII